MKRKPRIFFERIRPFHYPLLLYYLLRGYEISVFNFLHVLGIHSSRWVRELADKKRIRQIIITFTPAHGKAIDQTEVIFKRMPKTRIQLLLSKLYQSKETDLILKKMLLAEIFKCIYIHSYFNSMKNESSENIVFVPENYSFYERLIKKYGSYEFNHVKNVRVCKVILPVLNLIRISQGLAWFTIGVALFCSKILMVSSLFKKGESAEKAQYEYGVSLPTWHHIKSKGKRAFDFILDHKEINKNNTVFIFFPQSFRIGSVEPVVWIREQEQRGYHFLVLPDLKKIKDLLITPERVGFLFNPISLLLGMLQCLYLAPLFISAFIKSCVVYLQWNTILGQVHIQNYVYSNQEGWNQIAANILIRKNGGVTWNYSFYIGGGVLYAKDSDYSDVRHVIWAFLNSDHFLGVNQGVIEYHRAHHQKVRRYHAIGSIYSEMIHENIEEIDRDEFILEHFQKKVGKETMVISYFDTSFIDDDAVFTSYDDAIASYRDILKLVNEKEEVFLIVKPSKNEQLLVTPKGAWSSPKKGKIIISLWDTLKTHPRVYWAGDAGDSPAIMAVSDLVITHCMSSPTGEALGARKKAIWYESGNKHRGLVYDKIPGLVMHGYYELKERVNELLYRFSDEEYEEYLEKHIKGKVESRLDGQALSRFRRLISGGAS
jgi:polysaccharide biosynthesis PFTS motif protein